MNIPGMLSGPSPVAIGMATVAMETASSMATHPSLVMGGVLQRIHPNWVWGLLPQGCCGEGGIKWPRGMGYGDREGEKSHLRKHGGAPVGVVQVGG